MPCDWFPRCRGCTWAWFRAADLVATLRDAAGRVRTFYQQNPKHATVTFISGPSRTGDIEMRLTLGVHGPETTHAVVIR